MKATAYFIIFLPISFVLGMQFQTQLNKSTVEEGVKKEIGRTVHPSWDVNNDGLNDCESDGTCDHTIDYTLPRANLSPHK